MRTISMALAASALSVLSAGVAAPAAFAQDTETDITSFGFTVSPRTVKAGGQVNLTATDCEHQARASAGVFNAVPLGMAGDPMQSASVTVDWDAKPGAEYTVTFTCGPETGRTTLKIADTSSTSRPRPSPSGTTAKPTAKPTTTRSAEPTASASRPVKDRTAAPTTAAPTTASPTVKGTARARTSTAVPPSASASTSPSMSAPAGAAASVKPVRPARGGLGGSQTGDPVMVASGTAVSSVAVLGGAFMLRRRWAAE